MMSTYIPEFTTISEVCFSSNAGTWMPSSRFSTEQDFQIPDTPITYTIPLPPLLPTAPLTPLASPTGRKGLYPINVLLNILPVQEIELRNILLAYPIHIHTPQAHIGTITGATTSLTIDSFDLLLSLKSFARTQSDILRSPTYSNCLTQRMKVEVESAFFRRCGRPLSSFSIGEGLSMSSTEPTHEGLIGRDLLLGHVDVWGLERRSFYGYSVVHLA